MLGVTTVILKKNNRQITLLAEQDQLTGCKNRTGYERDIAHYQGQIENYPLFGIGILDLNALKAVNNLFGHQEGDAYLQILPRY
ncbi:MAG: GGDEF domain-containing protein [Pygmaiobacter sp.]